MSEAVTKDDFRAVAIMLERLASKVDAVIEAQVSMGDRLERKMTEMRADLLQRIELMEEVLRGHSNELRRLNGEVGGLNAEVGRLKDEVMALRRDVTNGFGKNDTDHAALEARATAIEEKLGIKKD